MKKPVLALLLAGANAQGRPDMAKDRAAPAPALRGDDKRMNDALEARSCLDAAGAVAQAQADLQAATQLVADKEGAAKSGAALVDQAVAKKATAVALVVAKDTAMKTLVDADHTADQALIAALVLRDSKQAAADLAAKNFAAKALELAAAQAQLQAATATQTLAGQAVAAFGTVNTAALTAQLALIKVAATTAKGTATAALAAAEAPLIAADPALAALADEAAFTAKKAGLDPGTTAGYADYAAYERARQGRRVYTAGLKTRLEAAVTDDALKQVQSAAKAAQIQTAQDQVATDSAAKTLALTTSNTLANAKTPDAAFTSAKGALEAKVVSIIGKYAAYLQLLSAVYFSGTAFQAPQMSSDGDLWLDKGTDKKCGGANAGPTATKANLGLCKAHCLELDGVGFHAVYTHANKAESVKAAGSAALNTAAAAKTLAAGKATSCVGVQYVGTTCTPMIFKTGEVIAAAGGVGGDACWASKQHPLAFAAHAGFIDYRTDADALAALIVTFKSKNGGTDYNTWNLARKGLEREKALYVGLKAKSDLRKAVWTAAVAAAAAAKTSASAAWALDDTALRAGEAGSATALAAQTAATAALTTATAQHAESLAQGTAWTAAKLTADGVKAAADGVAAALSLSAATMTTAIGAGDNSGLTKAQADSAAELGTAAAALVLTQTAATASEGALTAKLAERVLLVAAVATEEQAVAAEWAKIVLNSAALDAAVADVAAKQLLLTTAEVACKSAQYDAFKTALGTAETARAADLRAIETLLGSLTQPKLGATLGRCEKPMTNGDWAMRGKCADVKDCCGAARGLGPSGATLTIEVCQPKADKAYMYQPPRAPLATTMPAKVSWDFVCIGGATQLAGAAAALLASAYMMA